jgi:hypothetical protein
MTSTGSNSILETPLMPETQAADRSSEETFYGTGNDVVSTRLVLALASYFFKISK